MFLIDATPFLNETKEVMFFVRNEGEANRNITTAGYRVSESDSSWIRNMVTNNLSVPKKGETIIKMIINPSDLNSSDKLLCFGIANSAANQIADGLYMSVPYIRSINQDWNFKIVSDRCDSLGRLIKGTSVERPKLENGRDEGFQFFDETLGKAIWRKGTHWVDFADTTLPWPIVLELTNIISSNNEQPDADQSYTTILSAATGYTLPNSITVKIGTTPLSVGTDYTYNSSTGEVDVLGIRGTGGVTGTLTITASGVKNS